MHCFIGSNVNLSEAKFDNFRNQKLRTKFYDTRTWMVILKCNKRKRSYFNKLIILIEIRIFYSEILKDSIVLLCIFYEDKTYE